MKRLAYVMKVKFEKPVSQDTANELLNILEYDLETRRYSSVRMIKAVIQTTKDKKKLKHKTWHVVVICYVHDRFTDNMAVPNELCKVKRFKVNGVNMRFKKYLHKCLASVNPISY